MSRQLQDSSELQEATVGSQADAGAAEAGPAKHAAGCGPVHRDFGTPMQFAGTHANAVRGQADATLQHTSIAIAGVQTGMDLAKAKPGMSSSLARQQFRTGGGLLQTEACEGQQQAIKTGRHCAE